MRPDKSDMILLAANFTWHGLPVDVAVAAGTRPKQKALDWLKKFASEKKRLLIYQIGEDWFAFGPPAFQAEISERIQSGNAPWADGRFPSQQRKTAASDRLSQVVLLGPTHRAIASFYFLYANEFT